MKTMTTEHYATEGGVGVEVSVEADGSLRTLTLTEGDGETSAERVSVASHEPGFDEVMDVLAKAVRAWRRGRKG